MKCGLEFDIISFILFCLCPCTFGQYVAHKGVYHSHHEMAKELRHLVHLYPERSHLYSIGNSAEGQELWVISLASHTPRKHVARRPEIALVGNMHGDEAVGRELLLYLAAYLLEFYNYDPAVRQIMDNSRVHILPTMNPDGFAASIEGTCDGAVGRGNARKVDLNRNFPDIWEVNDIEREPETLAVIKWLESIPFILGANFHGGTLVANYPFDNNKDGLIQYSEAPDDDVLRHLALTYSKKHLKMYEGRACGDSMETFNDGITNGADWYPVTGSLQDYQYAFRGIMATTVEISCCKYPHADKLIEFWQENKDPMIEYLKQANTGVRGFVLDSNNGAGIKAVLQLHGRRMKFFTLSTGEYFRILLPGTYTMKIQTVFDYYESKTVTFVIPKDTLLLELNITLDYAFRSKGGNTRTSKHFLKHAKKTTKHASTTAQVDYVIETTTTEKIITTEEKIVPSPELTSSLYDDKIEEVLDTTTAAKHFSDDIEPTETTFSPSTEADVLTTTITTPKFYAETIDSTTLPLTLNLPHFHNTTEFAALTSAHGENAADFANKGTNVKFFSHFYSTVCFQFLSFFFLYSCFIF